MSGNHQFGSPKTVLNLNNDNKVVVNFEELDRIFSHADIQDRKVVILSMIGAFRGGKSFFLNYCLRFLYTNFPSINNPSKETQFIFEVNNNWMGEPDEPLTGFSWRAGSKRDTTGILFWSDVFLHTIDRTGEKIAIFVMDTQGLFDNDSTQADNSRIFTLATLMSSTLVLNVSNRIQEDQLQYLQYAMEVAKFTAMDIDKIKIKSFQNLMFLIRDWINDYEFHYGIDGGQQYVQDVFFNIPSSKEQLHSVRESISNNFEKIGSCLLPYPGRNVAGNKSYNGCYSQMDEQFRHELRNVIEHLLHPDTMIIKKIHSTELTCREFKVYIFKYIKLFQSDSILDSKSLYDMTVDSHMNILIEKCIKDYKMTIFINKDLINDKSAEMIHKTCKDRALDLFKAEVKLGTADCKDAYGTKLSNELDNIYKNCKVKIISNKQELINEHKVLEAEFNKAKLREQEIEDEKKQLEMRLNELNSEQYREMFDDENYKKNKSIYEDRTKLLADEFEQIQKNNRSNRILRAVLIKIAITVGTITLGPVVGVFAELCSDICSIS
ncbi:atlastin-2-like [Chironomus tepperi]|uniref:atlastin-2-like n=1 Tax=Chironomus tepperi TaxID=113505 RepID=UPI00391F9B1C